MNSIFIVDLCTCLHEVVYESTRLNLNVNRELYYELKQTLHLNEKQYLFRKWRLKLSIKLLESAHKRVSHYQDTSSSISKNKNNNTENNNIIRLRTKHLTNKQINLISFIKSYGNYLLTNLNRFQRILTLFIYSLLNFIPIRMVYVFV